MAEETIVADEHNVEETETEETDENEVEADEEKELLKQELAKANANKEKWEARYKSTKKQEASKPKETKVEIKEVDLDSLVEKKLMAIEEQREFIKTYGEDVFNEVKKIKEKHPTLSLNDAFKISPIAQDQASKEDPSTYSM